MKWFLGFLTAFIIYNLYLVIPAQAAYDPQTVANNKFGIHIISPSSQEASEAAQLVNNNGDWGYVTVIIEDTDRKIDKWQTFFNELRRRHLIPIVRIATHSDSGSWVKPNEGDENSWAEFLNNLVWPTKNRYVTIFNEPNHGNEWAGSVDGAGYAKVLEKYINALKSKSDDFFVINGGLDASAPQKLPQYEDEVQFLSEMNLAVPGIFDKLDGWSSHSYPNPDFSGSPSDSGRGSIRTWSWEKQILRSLGLKKDLPVFITETGWKHAEGTAYDAHYLTSERIGENFRQAFEQAWSDKQIIAVTPFLLDYQEDPFEHFSFKRPTGEKQKIKLLSQNVLGVQYPAFYPQYDLLSSLPKTGGHPIQEDKAQLTSSNFSSSIALNEQYTINIKVKNTGQSIWGENGPVRLIPIHGGSDLSIEGASLPQGVTVEPGQEYEFLVKLKSSSLGSHSGTLALFKQDKQFSSEPLTFTTETKSPVVVIVKSKLAWKRSSAGDYILSFLSGMTKTIQQVVVGSNGTSNQLQIHSLLPDSTYDFTLSKPYYHSKTVNITVHPGVNTLDFGQLQPDLPSAILNPPEFWQLLPWSK